MRRGKSGPEGGRAGGRRSLAGSADGPRREPRAGAPEPIGAAGACCWARFPRRRRDGRGLGFGPGPPCQVGSGGGGEDERSEGPRGERGAWGWPAAGLRPSGSGPGAGRLRCRRAACPAASGAGGAERERSPVQGERGSGGAAPRAGTSGSGRGGRLWSLRFLTSVVPAFRSS